MRIGPYDVGTPVVLAPMAGITNAAFRQLCREQAGAALAEQGLTLGGGLFVSEMVTSRALVERSPESMRLIQHGPGDVPRSVQLYGVDPATVGAAVRLLVDEDRADHIDLNFGCPVPKVTRKGGGAALPWKADLFRDIVGAAVRAAGVTPVTVKMRKGVDDDHLTFVQAGLAAEAMGVAAVSLHGRTAAQHYSGTADWTAIGELKAAVTSIPVLGNGDIFSAQDALDMMAHTGCDGVVVGRGCQGRPWLFADLAAAFDGRPLPESPTLGEVGRMIRRHAELLIEEHGAQRGIRDLRKHITWYLKGFPVGSLVRLDLGMVDSLADLDALIAQLDSNQRFPEGAEGPRGRQGSPQRSVHLPHGWLDDPDELAVPEDAELESSGG